MAIQSAVSMRALEELVVAALAGQMRGDLCSRATPATTRPARCTTA